MPVMKDYDGVIFGILQEKQSECVNIDWQT